MKIPPVLIGIINALLPGLGYLVIRERTVFGWLMLISSALILLAFLSDDALNGSPMLLAIEPMWRLAEAASYALMMLAFGYDAYDLARRKRLATAPVTPIA